MSGGARRLLDNIKAKETQGYVAPDRLSMALVGAEQMAQAVVALDAAVRARGAGVARLAVDPRWDALRDISEVQTMAKSIAAGAIR